MNKSYFSKTEKKKQSKGAFKLKGDKKESKHRKLGINW